MTSILVPQCNIPLVGRQGALGRTRVATRRQARRQEERKMKASEVRAEDRKYSTAEGRRRRSGRSAGGGEEPRGHTSSLSLC